jgi:dipeptidyl aminopeptidase/acylaminoacyl peptidase
MNIPVELLLSRRRLQEARLCDDGTVIWIEAENGRGKVCFQKEDGSLHDLTQKKSIKGGILYGGGEMDCRGSKVVFCEEGKRLFANDIESGTGTFLTPDWGKVSSPSISPNGNWVLYVFTDGETDLIAVAPMHGQDWPRQIVKGADFYLQPVWRPDGEWIAWVEWDHPLMPWQGSRVKLGEVGGMQLRLFNETWISGKPGQAAHQPHFSPNGKTLSYLQQNGDWEDLVLYDLKKKEKRILVHGEGFMLSTPDWVQGLRSYSWSFDSKNIFYLRYADAAASLWRVNVRSGKSVQIPTTPFTWLSHITCSSVSDSMVLMGSSPSLPKQIMKFQEGSLHTVRSSLDETFNGLALSSPQKITWKGLDGQDVFGLLYLPVGANEKNIPLIIEVHGGPTMQRSLSFAAEANFFASRGFGFLQVNYRGSSGYGAAYREALKGKWGTLEVDDIYSAAIHLIENGIAQRGKIALLGSSSGGTTVLNALRKYPGVFQAAICSYGIGDLITDAEQTHKFEKFYHHFLIGDVEKDRQEFFDRSPLFHIDEIKDALLLFHGSEDRVVDPSQSKALYDSLFERNIPCTLTIFEQEGHGFQREETLREYYRAILAFLENHLHLN